ncbi:MAG: B12-binding domain-containing protein [Acidimicrobiales bacterium]
MADEAMTLQQAAEALGVHYMTAYRYIRTGRLPATRVGGTWQVAAVDLDLVRPGRRSDQPGASGPGGPTPPPIDTQLEARLLAGDETGAWNLIEAALVSGRTPAGVLLDGMAPAMVGVGESWRRGEITVADEHRASATAIRLVSRLGALFTPRGRKRGTVVLCTPAGEHHGVPVAIAANLLHWRGFELVELGADTPGETVGEVCSRAHDLLAVAISCTMPDQDRAVRRTVAVLRRTVPATPVLVGGAGVADADDARRLGADRFSGRSGDELVVAIEDLALGATARA